MAGRIADALEIMREQYRLGADPTVILEDLLDLTHWLTRLKIAPEAGDNFAVAETERTKGRDFAAKLSMPVLTRSWQILLERPRRDPPRPRARCGGRDGAGAAWLMRPTCPIPPIW